MARSKAQAASQKEKGHKAENGEEESKSNTGSSDSGPVSVTAFMVRRAMAGVYLAAFLSLLAQADGLFGCSGLYPTPAAPLLYLTALLGSNLAALAFLAVRILERNALVTFATLWAMFAFVVHTAPGGYGQLEDKLVLDLGLVCLLLVPVRPSKGALELGQSAAAWLLFRALFSVATGRLATCRAWRDLSALHHSAVLEPFPLPLTWLLFKAPFAASAPLTLLQIWAEMVVSVLVLLRAQGIGQTAASLLMISAAGVAFVANRGCFTPCIFTLLFAQMDDEWHRGTWSAAFLENWGVPPRPGDKRGRRSRTAAPAQKAAKEEGGQPLWWAVATCLFFGTVASAALGVVAGMAADAETAATAQAPDGDAFAAVRALVAGRSAEQWMAAAKVPALVACVLSAFSVLGSAATPLVKKVGILFWAAGSVHLAGEIAPSSIQAVAKPVSAVLELAHLSHSFWPSEAEAAPRPSEKGVPVVSLEAMTPVTDTIDTRGRSTNRWSQIGPRFQPIDEMRPPLLQPYTPRADLAMWNLGWQVEHRLSSQRGDAVNMPIPSWLPQLMDALYRRKGESARLIVGPVGWWGSLMKSFYTSSPGQQSYISATEHDLLQRLRMVWMRRRYTTDIHENRWWEHVPRSTEDHLRVLFDMQVQQSDSSGYQLIPNPSMFLDSEEAVRGIRSLPPSCPSFPWEGLPAAEVLLALAMAAFLTAALMPP